MANRVSAADASMEYVYFVTWSTAIVIVAPAPACACGSK
jgi:hypothetical protein